MSALRLTRTLPPGSRTAGGPARWHDGLVRHHLCPALGALLVPDITEAHVRRWRKNLLDNGVGSVTVAKAYRLLKAILNTAVDDGLIRRNPCRIKGAGQERSPERPVLTVRQVFDLADAFDRRYRLLILLAVFGSLRWGELAALRRRHIDMASGAVRIETSVVELVDGSLVTGPPKSPVSRRTVSIPTFLLADVRFHLEHFTRLGDDSLVFTGPKAAPLRRSNFTRAWRQATTAARLAGVHFHDLRHTANTMAKGRGVALGATFREKREDTSPALQLPRRSRRAGRVGTNAAVICDVITALQQPKEC